MINTLRSALLGALLMLAPPAMAQSVDEAAAVEDVIQSQISAIQGDDWELAFTYASPNIQGIFGDPEKFSAMVKNGFPMVWRPRDVRTGAIKETPQGLQQTMFFEDQKGRVFIADYYMVQIDGEWRINGVNIRRAPEQSA